MDWIYIKKAITSAVISLGGATIVVFGTWLASGNFDLKTLGIALSTAVGSFLIALGKIIGQQSEASKQE